MSLPPPPPPAPPHLPPMRRRTNGMAVASLACSLATLLVGVTFVLGIVFGHVALRQIERDPGQDGRGMALAGVIIGWICVGLVVLVLVTGIAQ